MGKSNMKPIVKLGALVFLAAGVLASPTWAQTKPPRNQRHVSAVEQHRAATQIPEASRVAPSAAIRQPEYPPNFGWDVSY